MRAIKRTGLMAAIPMVCLIFMPCVAAEILFQNQNASRTGVVVGEDGLSVTIRFRKDTIKSIGRDEEDKSADFPNQVILEKGKNYFFVENTATQYPDHPVGDRK